MIQLFHSSLGSPFMIILIAMYFICEAVSAFDTRIIQAKKQGYLRTSEASVPEWTGIFAILGWVSFASIILLNWKYAILVFIIKFALKVLPILENLGALIIRPIVGKETAAAVNVIAIEQRKANSEIKTLSGKKGKR